MSAPQVVHGSLAYPRSQARPVVTIGNFDGVHRGHRALVRTAIERAKQLGEPSCVYTFDPAPRDVLRPDNPVQRIQSLDAKIALLGSLGVDQVVVEPFTRDFGAHGGEWFADEVLTRRLRASTVVVGWDFRFGKGRSGTVDALREWMDVPVVQVSALADGDAVVSSSRIREALLAGDVAQAEDLLARPHLTTGRVVSGHGRGRRLGIRTANLELVAGLRPAIGVYVVEAIDATGAVRQGVANIGERPTFPTAGPAVEVHLFDLDADLYGQTLDIRWLARLRDEQRFESAEALVEQITRDIAAARAFFAG